VSFASMMIPQDIQAIAMVDLALKHATNAKIKTLAPQIKKAATPEVARMSGWFTSVGSVAPGSAGYHDMSGMAGMASHQEGLISAKEMTALGKAKGAGFDKMWLRLMAKNRKGAMTMAKAEVASGGSPDVKQVAQSIVDTLPPQIDRLTAVLAGSNR
jgi:uncharacterized protein (DUF305 family)